MDVKVEGTKLIVEIELQSPHRSKSGKTFIVATTNGFVKTSAEVNGKPVSVSLNATIKG